jgi:hypothetical protein
MEAINRAQALLAAAVKTAIESLPTAPLILKSLPPPADPDPLNLSLSQQAAWDNYKLAFNSYREARAAFRTDFDAIMRGF